MAEQPQGYEFVPVGADDILKERQYEWQRFTFATKIAIGAVVVVLLLLLIFVA